jgi:hypothetical protein
MANLKLKTLPVFPTKVTGTGGISVNKVNGVWTIDPDWTALTLVESVSAPEDKQLWCYDPSTDTYVRLTVDALIDSLPDGPPGGFKQNFDSATADADPGAGEFRFNNATVASATAAYLDNADVEGADISGLLDLWDNSTSDVKGVVRFEKTTDPSVWAQFDVTGSVVDGTGYRKITLQNGVSNGTFTAGDRFAVAFFGTGNTPTVAVGTTTTLSAGSSATVTNSGTASDLVLDFGIPRGADASFKWLYESSTSMAAPATGGMRFNNATLSSVTAIAINAQTADTGNPDQSDYIIKWDDSTSTPKAYVEIREEAGSSAVYQLSAVTDNTTWLQLDVAYVSGAIDLTAGDALYFTPHLIGNKGTDGDVVGPASSTDGSLARFDGTDGKLLKDGAVIGVDVQAYDADTAKTDTAQSWTAVQTFGSAIVLQAAREKVTRSATAADGTINFDALTQGILHYTTDATGNFVLNFRGDGSTTLNSLMSIDQIWSFLFKAEQGGTAYALTDVTVDGNAVAELLWADGLVPDGAINSCDEYQISIEKTADATFTVEVIKTSFAAAP